MKKNKKIIWYVIVGLLIILLAKVAIFEIFKTCGNCGYHDLKTTNTLQLDESSNGKAFNLNQGGTIQVVLNNTYWQFQENTRPQILQQVHQPTYNAVPLNKTIPGSGAGTVTEDYQAISPGQTDIVATRTSCGEAMLCAPDKQRYTVRIVVIPSK